MEDFFENHLMCLLLLFNNTVKLHKWKIVHRYVV